MKKYRAKFKCLKCEHVWKDVPKMTPCIKCGHKYVKWKNYEQTFGKLSLEELKK